MKFRDRETGEILSWRQVRDKNANVSIPRVIRQSTYDYLGVDVVVDDKRPEVTEYERIVEGPVVFQNGQWTQTWLVVNRFPSYTGPDGVQVTTEQQIQAYNEAKTLRKRQRLSCTPRQARLALNAQGLLESVQTAINSLPEPQRSQVQIEWEYATTIERTSPWMATMGEALGLSEEQLDALFETAATL